MLLACACARALRTPHTRYGNGASKKKQKTRTHSPAVLIINRSSRETQVEPLTACTAGGGNEVDVTATLFNFYQLLKNECLDWIDT